MKGFILKKNILGLFLEKLFEFPLWVKQIIYLRLYQNLQVDLSEDFIATQEEDLFHLHIPQLTFAGKTEMLERKGGFDPNTYNFLTSINEELSMIEIAMNNYWTMEEVSKYYVFCLEQNYIKPAESVYIGGIAGFMSGKYRTGEYFKRIGRINVDQLEHTIVQQKELNDKGTPKKMAEIMISLGYITEKETASLLKIKEESKKRFILDTSIIPKGTTIEEENVNTTQEELKKLKEENDKLKDQLRKLLAFVKKNG